MNSIKVKTNDIVLKYENKKETWTKVDSPRSYNEFIVFNDNFYKKK